MTATTPEPLVVAVDMGYGHLRAARPLADALRQPVVHVDRPPLAGPDEQRLWRRVRSGYEWMSRLSQVPLAGGPLRLALDRMTSIPRLHPYRDLSRPTRGVITLERLIRRNLGEGLVAELRRTGAPLLTTFYSPAIVADRAGLDDIHCVVTDTDVNRIWAPVDARATRIHYLAPTHQVVRRLRSYGVPAERITFTGFPLPDELVGGAGLTTLTRNLAARLVRLDPAGELRRELAEEIARFIGPLPESQEGVAPLLVFAVGGAGAQARMAHQFLPGLRKSLEEGRLRIALVAGVKPAVAEVFREALHRAGLEGAIGHGVEILLERDFDSYYSAFNALVARADVLWTKPSELCFYAALGLPLVCGPPLGVHERYNRRWVREAGAGVKQRDPRFAAEWLDDMLRDGSLAAAAWSGFLRLPKFGLYRILEVLRRGGFTSAGEPA
ncbi:MAG TPA: hypothetical protein VFK85_05455 [Anaeromyxobacteraceae bacterium]|nr:hypothetical protein [Anaeromyxobacteraceae bacterium]